MYQFCNFVCFFFLKVLLPENKPTMRSAGASYVLCLVEYEWKMLAKSCQLQFVLIVYTLENCILIATFNSGFSTFISNMFRNNVKIKDKHPDNIEEYCKLFFFFVIILLKRRFQLKLTIIMPIAIIILFILFQVMEQRTKCMILSFPTPALDCPSIFFV
jgi:hypothetical protein